jgi:5-amino-6-(5-phosphoribosylamino)uracil reductase
VPDRPYTLLSCSMSLDGYLGGATERRLLLSNEADFDRVDEVRAGCDAILVGAVTVRKDNPRLLVRAPQRQRERAEAGLSTSPLKVTVTAGGNLDPRGNFFTVGNTEKLVYCGTDVVPAARDRLGRVATVVDAGRSWRRMHRVGEDLHDRGVRRLMVEGGGTVHTQFLTDGLADELQLVIAPFFVGDSKARRFVDDGLFPWGPDHRARLVETRQLGDVVLLRYALSDRFGTDGP